MEPSFQVVIVHIQLPRMGKLLSVRGKENCRHNSKEYEESSGCLTMKTFFFFISTVDKITIIVS